MHATLNLVYIRRSIVIAFITHLFRITVCMLTDSSAYNTSTYTQCLIWFISSVWFGSVGQVNIGIIHFTILCTFTLFWFVFWNHIPLLNIRPRQITQMALLILYAYIFFGYSLAMIRMMNDKQRWSHRYTLRTHLYI